jgi:hypothetical protein
MKKFLAYIFLFIFSFQVLPVKEIGQILFKGLMTEEIHETVDENSGSSKLKKEPAKLYFKAESLASIKYLTKKIQTAIHESESLPRHFVPDILTPPPNRC